MMAALARCSSNVLSINRLSTPVVCQVRFKRREPLRKLVWLPQAPSKLYKIKPLPVIPEEEKKMREKLTFDYEAAYCSIVNHCYENFYLPSRSSEETGSKSAVEVKEDEEFKAALRRNEEENKRVAAARALRREEEMAQVKAYLLEQQSQYEEEQKVLSVKAREDVEIEMKRSSSFITKDKLTEAIEEALLNPVHYEWAVDRQGRVYYDGAIHANAFTPTAVPDTSSHKDLTMKELPRNFRLKAHKLY